MLANIAFHRETFSQYFMINISISITNNSQITIYSTPSLINNGRTNRNNGRVIVDAKIHIKRSLQLEILSFFRNNFAIAKRIIVSIKTVKIHAIQNFINLLLLTNSTPCSLSTNSNE
jgi:hypothetical protein